MRPAGGRGPRGVALIEPYAAIAGGHWAKALPLLARAARDDNRACAVVTVKGIDGGTRREVERAGALVIERPKQWLSWPALLLCCATTLRFAHEALRPRLPKSALPYQPLHFARCLEEAAAIRIGRQALAGAGDHQTIAILTANETLHACATALAGGHHVRYVHEVDCHEGPAIRLLERCLRSRLRATTVLCPAEGVSVALRERYPTIAPVVQTFGLRDPTAYLDEDERRGAARRLGIRSEADPVASLVGGWWRSKDIRTITAALALIDRPFTLLVAGDPLDRAIVKEMASVHSGELVVLERHLTADELRLVYAASDFTVVSRLHDGKESGIVLDAACYGVPLVSSDHNVELTSVLAAQPWARVFRSGDPRSLAEALTRTFHEPLPRPPRSASASLRMIDGVEMLETLERVSHR